MSEVVRAELHLEPVDGARLGDGHHAGVVDQHVEVTGPAVGEGAHRTEVGEVETAHLARAGDRRRGGAATFLVAHGQHDVGTDAGQLARRDEPEAAVRPGDHDGGALEVGKVGGGPAAGHADGPYVDALG